MVLPVVFIDLQSPVDCHLFFSYSSLVSVNTKIKGKTSSPPPRIYVCMYVSMYVCVCVCVCATSLHDDPVEEAFMEKSKGHGPSPCPFFSSFYL